MNPRGIPFQTKLLPYLDEIRDLRRHRKTYPEISRILVERHGEIARAAPSTIHSAVKVRARRASPFTLPEPTSAVQKRVDNADPIQRLRNGQNPNFTSGKSNDPWEKLKPSNKPLIIDPHEK